MVSGVLPDVQALTFVGNPPFDPRVPEITAPDEGPVTAPKYGGLVLHVVPV